MAQNEIYEDRGIRFEYPADWKLEVTDDGPTTTVDVQHPSGIAFLLVRTDVSCPDPDEEADLVLDAMRDEYPELDAVPVAETMHEQFVTGHDIEFFSLDISNWACIRCFQTPRRTVVAFGQWSDLGEENLPEVVDNMLHSLEETED
jgi:hypothetical protein